MERNLGQISIEIDEVYFKKKKESCREECRWKGMVRSKWTVQPDSGMMGG